MQHITITSADWTMDAFRADWADDATLTEAQVTACADAEYAWLINNTGTRLQGWAFGRYGFSGPPNKDAVAEIGALLADASDYVLSVMDEIKAETPDAPALPALPADFRPAVDGCVYHRDAFSDVKRNLCGKAAAWYRVEGDLWCDAAMRSFTAEMGASDPAVLGAVKVG